MEKYLHWYISPVCILIHMHVHRCSVCIDIWAFNGGVGETVKWNEKTASCLNPLKPKNE